MKNLLAVLAAIALSVPAMAADIPLSDADKAYLKDNKVTLPIPLYPNQVTGLHWLLNHECKPGPFKVGGIDITCKGDQLADVNNYLDLVAVSNFMNAEDESGCKPVKRTGPPLIAKPLEQLSDVERAWLKEHNIDASLVLMTAPQIAGLKQLIDNGCAAGKRKIGGIDMVCKGEKAADTDNYLDLVGTANYLDSTTCGKK